MININQKSKSSKIYIQRTVTNNEPVVSKYLTEEQVNELLLNKQDLLISGENIKTINGDSILGSGDINIENIPYLILSNYNKTKGEIIAGDFSAVSTAIKNKKPYLVYGRVFESKYGEIFVLANHCYLFNGQIRAIFNFYNGNDKIINCQYNVNEDGVEKNFTDAINFQKKIDDLDTIRSGAAKGETSVQGVELNSTTWSVNDRGFTTLPNLVQTVKINNKLVTPDSSGEINMSELAPYVINPLEFNYSTLQNIVLYKTGNIIITNELVNAIEKGRIIILQDKINSENGYVLDAFVTNENNNKKVTLSFYSFLNGLPAYFRIVCFFTGVDTSISNVNKSSLEVEVLGGIYYTHLQKFLEDGVNIKTINGNSILGEGDITIEGGNNTASSTLFLQQVQDLGTRKILSDKSGYEEHNREVCDRLYNVVHKKNPRFSEETFFVNVEFVENGMKNRLNGILSYVNEILCCSFLEQNGPNIITSYCLAVDVEVFMDNYVNNNPMEFYINIKTVNYDDFATQTQIGDINNVLENIIG